MFKRWGFIVFLFLATLFPAGAQVFEPDTLDAAFVRADDHYIRAFLKKLDRSLAANDPDNAEDWRSRVYTKIELDVDNMERMLEDGILHQSLIGHTSLDALRHQLLGAFLEIAVLAAVLHGGQ